MVHPRQGGHRVFRQRQRLNGLHRLLLQDFIRINAQDPVVGGFADRQLLQRTEPDKRGFHHLHPAVLRRKRLNQRTGAVAAFVVHNDDFAEHAHRLQAFPDGAFRILYQYGYSDVAGI